MNRTGKSIAGLLAASALGVLGGIDFNKAPDPGARQVDSSKANPGTPLRDFFKARAEASIFGGMGRSRSGPRTPGPGWSYRHVKRMARKARNVKANRRNHRG